MTDPNQPLSIRFERSGGVAGMLRSLDISTEDLSAEQAAELRSALADADFFALPPEITGDNVVMDDFIYVITVDTGERRSTVRTSGVAAPESMRPLLDWLNQALRSGGG